MAKDTKPDMFGWQAVDLSPLRSHTGGDTTSLAEETRTLVRPGFRLHYDGPKRILDHDNWTVVKWVADDGAIWAELDEDGAEIAFYCDEDDFTVYQKVGALRFATVERTDF